MDVRWLSAASAAALLAFALRLRQLRRRIEALSPEEEQARRAVLLRQIRSTGVVLRLVQLALFFAMLLAEKPSPFWRFAPLPWYLLISLVQASVQFRVEKRLRHTEATAGEHFKFTARVLTVTLLQTLSLMALSGGACWAYSMFLIKHHLYDGHPILQWGGVALIVLTVLSCYYAASPWLVRLSIPCEPLEDPELRARLEACFQRAGLKIPRPYLMKLERFGTHNAMIVGLRTKVEWLPSAVIVSRTLAEKLTPEEFEAVILHETSHVALRHVSKRLLTTIVALALAIGLTMLWSPLAHARFSAGAVGLFDYLVIVGMQVAFLRWQVRYQELEADSHAVLALGATPAGLIGGLAKTMRLNDLQTSQNDPNAVLCANAAHPTIAARAAELNRRVQAQRDGRPIDLRWEPYRGLLGGRGKYYLALAGAGALFLAVLWLTTLRPRHELVAAAGSGDLRRVQEFARRGLQALDPSGDETPLTAAVRGRHAEVVEWLLSHGASPDRPNRAGLFALVTAAHLQDRALVGALLRGGARTDVVSKGGLSPLLEAAKHGDPAIVALLLDHGARVDMDGGDGETPLQLAITTGRDDAARLLIRRGAEPGRVNRDDQTALELAIAHDRTAVVDELLSRRGGPDPLDNDHLPLQWAVQYASTATLALLLSRGARVNAVDSNGSTPLMWAGDQAGIVRTLLAHGASVNQRAAQGWTALMSAAEDGNPEVVSLLLARGAKADAKDEQGQTPLGLAIENENPEAVALLRKAGAKDAGSLQRQRRSSGKPAR